MSEVFEINEIIWAKVVGYPWWPAQIASITTQVVKGNSIQVYRVLFIADQSHADLHKDKVKKWDDKPNQQETKKLKEAIQQAQQILQGTLNPICKPIVQLNDHSLKNLVIQLFDYSNKVKQIPDNSMEDLHTLLNKMNKMEILHIVKLNCGQYLVKLFSAVKKQEEQESFKLLDELLDTLISIIGFKRRLEQQNKKKVSLDENLEDITKNVFTQSEVGASPIKKKKLEQDAEDNIDHFNQI